MNSLRSLSRGVRSSRLMNSPSLPSRSFSKVTGIDLISRTTHLPFSTHRLSFPSLSPALIGLSEEQTEFYNLAKAFADKELAPNAGPSLPPPPSLPFISPLRREMGRGRDFPNRHFQEMCRAWLWWNLCKRRCGRLCSDKTRHHCDH
jgi:hypothetical protein